MEVITVLVLIFLSSVGAKNIPVLIDQPLELPPVFDDLPRCTKTPLVTIFPAWELVESVVCVEDPGLHLNQNADQDEKNEEHVYSVVKLDTVINMNYEQEKKNNQEEEMDSALRHVEAIEGQNNKKTKEGLLEDRVSLGAPCPPGKVRVVTACWEEDKHTEERIITT